MYIVNRKINQLLTVGDVVIQVLGYRVKEGEIVLGIAAPPSARIVKHGFPSDVYQTETLQLLRDSARDYDDGVLIQDAEDIPD